MSYRNVVRLVAFLASLAISVGRAGADCVYSVAHPGGGAASATITDVDGSGSFDLDAVAGVPSAVLPAPNGSETYVGTTISTGGCSTESRVVAISSAGQQRSVTLARPGYFGGMAIHPDGSVLYAVDSLVGRLAVIQVSTFEVIKVLPLMHAVGQCPSGDDLPGPEPVGIAVSPDGGMLLVTSVYCGNVCFGTLTVVDATSNTMVEEIDAQLFAIGFAPDSSLAYLSGGIPATLTLFNRATWQLSEGLPLETSGLATAPDGVFALTPTGLQVLDPKTNMPVRHINQSGRLIASDTAADRVYVATSDRTEVVVLKASTGRETDRVPLENPSWIAAGPCPQSGGGGGAGCNIDHTAPTWPATALLLLCLGLRLRRRRST